MGQQLQVMVRSASAPEPEPTGINKILVEQFGYEFIGGVAYAPGTAPAPSDAALRHINNNKCR